MGGVDFKATGEVKKIDVVRIRERLNSNCIVMLSNLGYSGTGEVLSCKYVSSYPLSKILQTFSVLGSSSGLKY